MLTIFYALVLGFMMILDPCTLFTSVAAIGYIDRELQNKKRVLTCGLMFVLGKLAAYVLLSIPFIMGAQTEGIHHVLNEWGEPLLCVFMLVCGVLLLFTGHHHHDHDHGLNHVLQNVDDKSSWLWSFMLGIFFAIAFCPHRLVYFFTMIDLAVTADLTPVGRYMLPVLFGLATGLPIMILAWIISYTAVNSQTLTEKLGKFEHWFRYACAVLFLGYGLYLGIHLLGHEEGCDCHHHHHHEHAAVMMR